MYGSDHRRRDCSSPMTCAVNFDILRALEPTPVRAPRALWIDESGDVFGRPFYVMERLEGTVYEREIPVELANAPERIHRMSERVIEQIAAIHLVDVKATGLDALGDGHDFLDRQLDHWEGEIHRMQRGPLPALEQLLRSLREQQPEPPPASRSCTVTPRVAISPSSMTT